MKDSAAVLTNDTQLVRNHHLFTALLDEDLVMMDESQCLYVGLNVVGHKIWDLLDKPLRYRQLITSLTDLYDVSEPDCQKSVIPFLLTMVKNKLVDKVQPI